MARMNLGKLAKFAFPRHSRSKTVDLASVLEKTMRIGRVPGFPQHFASDHSQLIVFFERF
jgi:hypothetical protein